ncbi:hypothetical protein CDS [Bradyrhizobium sp.]|nr:hypothetical protein CDS [Bradyrhizobium sp.]
MVILCRIQIVPELAVHFNPNGHTLIGVRYSNHDRENHE